MEKTTEKYLIYKSRRDWLKNEIIKYQMMECMSSQNKELIIKGLVHELMEVKSKIKELLW